MGEFVIREIYVTVGIFSAILVGLFCGGCAPHREPATVSAEARSTQRGNSAVESGESHVTPTLAETCVPENTGPLGVRVKGGALSPDRVFKTNDRNDWPVYAPPEEVRVTLPEMPPELAHSSRSNADENGAAPLRSDAVPPEGEKIGDRSLHRNGTGSEDCVK